MLRSRKLVVRTLLALMFLVAVPSASATSRETTSSKIVRQPGVEWTLPAGQCPSLPSDVTVSGDGQRLQVITTIKQHNDQTEIIDHDFVTGTAKDDKGGTYYFVYTNQTRQLVPKRGSPIKVDMTDSFVLTGNDGAANLNIAFVWHWTYRPADGEVYWPPVHNWKKEFTLGDPLVCDPI
jgi:hypothetical protein